jgi:hemolysin III
VDSPTQAFKIYRLSIYHQTDFFQAKFYIFQLFRFGNYGTTKYLLDKRPFLAQIYNNKLKGQDTAMTTAKLQTYTPKEELLSSLIHGLGIGLALTGLVLLIVFSALYGDVWTIVSCIIFGISMTVLYTASTLYHAFKNEHIKQRLKKFDHISIYYLIAGTYTPFLLVTLRGTMGWILFGIIWGLAVLGTILKLTTSGSGTKLWSIGLYLVMGWLVVTATKPLTATLPHLGLIFLVLGGLFYTVGILFYLWKTRRYTHAVWHLFVLTGTVMHFFAVLYSCVLN